MLHCPCSAAREHSPFVTITIEVAIGWLFEDGYAKEAARYFQTAGNSFRTMLKKLPCRCMLNIRTNGECPHATLPSMKSTSAKSMYFRGKHHSRGGHTE